MYSSTTLVLFITAVIKVSVVHTEETTAPYNTTTAGYDLYSNSTLADEVDDTTNDTFTTGDWGNTNGTTEMAENELSTIFPETASNATEPEGNTPSQAQNTTTLTPPSSTILTISSLSPTNVSNTVETPTSSTVEDGTSSSASSTGEGSAAMSSMSSTVLSTVSPSTASRGEVKPGSTGSSKDHTALALGIVIPVMLIAVIAAAYFLHKRHIRIKRQGGNYLTLDDDDGFGIMQPSRDQYDRDL